MIAPYLRGAESELDFWDDSRLQGGQQWNAEIQGELLHAGARVALVSSNFLSSQYIIESELPLIVRASSSKTAIALTIRGTTY